MKLLAICGSLRANSSNLHVLKYLAGQLPAGIEYTIYNDLGNLPHFNPDQNHENIPVPVIGLRKMIMEADAVIICSPEYAFGIPGSLKNALDWTVASGEFADKPVAVITASSVGTTAHEALLLVLRTMSAYITEDASLLISYVRTKVSADGEIADAATVEHLRSLLQVLINSAADKLPI